MRRWVVVAVVLVVLVVGYFGVGAYRQSRTDATLAKLQTVQVTRGNLTATVGATGTLRANQTAILTFGTSGTVEWVGPKTAETVREEDILATLEDTSIPSQVILARADLVSAQRALDQLLDSDVARAQAQLALAQAEDALKDANYRWRVQQQGNRASDTVIKGAEANIALAEEEIRMAEEAYHNAPTAAAQALAQSNLSAAEQKRDSLERKLNWYLGKPTDIDQAILDGDVALAEAHLADAEREWDRVKDGPDPNDVAAAEARVAAAQATADLALVKAPFGGSITSVDVKPGDRVSPGQAAFGLADLSRLLVDVQIPEVDVNRIEVGQQVVMTFDAVPGRDYQGEVADVGLTGTVVQGVVNFDVTVEVKDPDDQIKPGMTVAVNIIIQQIQDVLLVPNRAVRIRDGERVVYVLRDGVPHSTPIILGASSDLESQVAEGDIKAGDLIVLNPPAEFEQSGHPPFVQR